MDRPRGRTHRHITILVQCTEDFMKKHYADLSSKKFFPGLVKYMSSGPVVAMVRDKQKGCVSIECTIRYGKDKVLLRLVESC